MEIMKQQSSSNKNRRISDIWNVLIDSEKKLCIRYSFDALKVNTVKNIATSQTEAKFGSNRLVDIQRRHTEIWIYMIMRLEGA